MFTGNIDGNGKTIKNVLIDVNTHAPALIGQMRGNNSYLKNLTVDGITLKFPSNASYVKWSGTLVGYVEGTTSGKVTIENCEVKNINIDNGANSLFTAGGLIGYISSTNVDVIGCKVNGGTINGNGQSHCSLGGLVGKIYQAYTVNLTDCSISNLTTYYADTEANISLDAGCADGAYVGSIFNYGNGANFNLNINRCTYTNWKDIAIQMNNHDISGMTFATNKLFPFIGGFDSYKSNTASKITLDGRTLFPF